jgi:hypothetical protein
MWGGILSLSLFLSFFLWGIHRSQLTFSLEDPLLLRFKSFPELPGNALRDGQAMLSLSEHHASLSPEEQFLSSQL